MRLIMTVAAKGLLSHASTVFLYYSRQCCWRLTTNCSCSFVGLADTASDTQEILWFIGHPCQQMYSVCILGFFLESGVYPKGGALSSADFFWQALLDWNPIEWPRSFSIHPFEKCIKLLGRSQKLLRLHACSLGRPVLFSFFSLANIQYYLWEKRTPRGGNTFDLLDKLASEYILKVL